MTSITDWWFSAPLHHFTDKKREVQIISHRIRLIPYKTIIFCGLNCDNNSKSISGQYLLRSMMFNLFRYLIGRFSSRCAWACYREPLAFVTSIGSLAVWPEIRMDAIDWPELESAEYFCCYLLRRTKNYKQFKVREGKTAESERERANFLPTRNPPFSMQNLREYWECWTTEQNNYSICCCCRCCRCGPFLEMVQWREQRL